MIRPLIAAQRFGWACVLGMGLGLFYSFLRPVRPRFLADLLFVPALFKAWIVLSFQICRGDIRVGITFGLLVGFFLWLATFGHWLQSLFWGFWRVLSGVFRRILGIIKKFFKKFLHFTNFFLAYRKK